MYHLDNTSGVPEMPEPKDQQSISPRWFGESQEQGGISWPGADWFNTVQAELLNMLHQVNLPPDKKSFDQLSKAVLLHVIKGLNDNLNVPDGFKFMGQVPNVATLSAIQGKNGDRVLLESYYGGWAATLDGEALGGGEFFFDSSQVGINNGVTIFNGWVRKVKDKTLTTYDAGLTPDDGTNATSRLQALVDVLKKKYTLVGYGKHRVNDHIVFDSIRDLTIINGGGFCVSARELRDSWTHHGWEGNELPDAVLYFRFCPGLKITSGVTVIGARSWNPDYNPAQTFEMGDAGIRLHHCPGFKISGVEVSHVFTWGIYSEYGDGGEVSWSYVHDGCRQSGINICAYSSNVTIDNNIVENFPLYGVELENFPYVAMPVPTEYVSCKSNTLIRCGKGIGIVGNIVRADVITNTSIECYSGYFTRTEGFSKRISLKSNVAQDCQNGLEITSSTNVYVDDIDISAYNPPATGLFTSPYDAVMKWGNDKSQFYTHGWSPLAQAFILGQVNSLIVWLNGVKYTAIAGVRDDNVSLGSNAGISYACLITLDKPLTEDVELFTPVSYTLTNLSFSAITKGVYTRQYNSNFQKNDKIFVTNAKIRGVQNAIHTTEVYDDNTSIRQRLTNNEMDDCPYWLRGGGNGIYIEGNRPSKGCSAAITQGAPNLISSYSIPVQDHQRKNTTDAPRNCYFPTLKNQVCVGFTIIFQTPSNAGPSDIIVRLNGQLWYTFPASKWVSTGLVNVSFVALIAAADNQYITIDNAAGNLGYVAFDMLIHIL